VGLRAIIMLVIGLAGSAWAVWRPFAGLLLLAFLYFFRPSLWGAEAYVRPVEWITAATLVGWLVHESKKGVLRGTFWIVVFALLYVLLTAAAPYADAQSWASALQIIKILVFVFLIVRLCDTPRRIAQFCGVIVLSCIWFLKVVLVNWFTYGMSADIRVDTAVGQGGGSNFIAWILAVTFPLVLYKAVRGTAWQRKLAFALLPLWLICQIATGSRGGLVCTAASALVTLVMLRRFRAIAVMGLCVLVLAIAAPSSYWERMRSIFTTDPQKMDISARNRYYNLLIGRRIIEDYPAFGIGLDAFPRIKMKYAPPEYKGGQIVAHNTYIQMASELGLGFLSVFLVFNAWLAWRLLRAPRRLGKDDRIDELEWVRIGTLAAMVATWLQMLKGDMAKIDYFWWLYGMGLVVDHLYRRAVVAEPTQPRPVAQRSAYVRRGGARRRSDSK